MEHKRILSNQNHKTGLIMKRFNIIQKSTGNILDHGDFATDEQGYAWFEPFITKGRYGAIEQPELKELQDVLITPAVLDPETGEELEPAVYEQQEVVVRPYAPAEYTIEITDVTTEVEAQQELNEKLANGESIKIRCERAISLILDYNSEFTFEQIDQLEQDFGEIYNCLMRRRIDKAYMLISQTEPTDLISQEFLDLLKQTLIE